MCATQTCCATLRTSLPKWCSSDFEGCETISKRFFGIFGWFFLDFRLMSDAAVQGHWSGVTGGGSPPLNVGNMLDVVVDRYMYIDPKS